MSAPPRGQPLPIDPALPEIVSRLVAAGAVVVVSPPGSGKTTRLPPAFLDAGLLAEGACLVVEPRRVAARAAAQRVAEERGWSLGGEVGYEVRFDRKLSARTRLAFVTTGILLARLQADPLLEEISVVALDEFHERSLELDLALAFLREARAARPELRLAVLSATLDPGPVASYLGAETIHVPGRTFPVEVSYLPKIEPDALPQLPRRVAGGIRRAWEERPAGRGDVLAFLPGAGEIRRTSEALEAWAAERGAALSVLHGDLPLDAQAQVLRRPPGSPARVILATNVAETSVTVEGVAAVVDSGYARVLRHDRALGLDRLELAPISRAAADQRAGRAGRLAPGKAYRLWTLHEDRSRPAETPPEVLRADLAGALLQILAWGGSAATFPWFQRPPADALGAALALLARLGAVDPAGHLTELGEKLRRVPLHPRLGRMLAEGAASGLLREGAAVAALASERDLLVAGRALAGEHPTVEAGDSDLLHRLDLLEEAEARRFEPERLRPLGIDAAAARIVARVRDQLQALGSGAFGRRPRAPEDAREEALLRVLLAGYPDRVGRRRGAGSRRFVLVGGSGAVLAEGSSVLRPEFIVAVRLEGGRRGERAEALIRWASRIEPEWLRGYGPIERRRELAFAPEGERVVGTERELFDGLPIGERSAPPDPGAAAALLAGELAKDPLARLRPGSEVLDFLARCRFLARAMPELGFPDWSPEEWEKVLEGLCAGKTSFAEVRRADLGRALRARLTRPQSEALERQAPARVEVPSGSRIRVEYPDEGPPTLSVRIQEAFGWSAGPRVAAGRVPVLLHLLGPHGRPLQVTADLQSFWETTYPQIRRELRGRYPRHFWPEDPRQAPPKLLVKKVRRG